MTEALSATTFMIGARFPWAEAIALPDEAGPLDGTIVHGSGGTKNCSIRKISTLGAKLSWSSIMPWIRELMRKEPQ